MDVNLDEDHLELAGIARQFFTARSPATAVRELEESDLGYDADVWREMAGLDWLALGHPADAGGVGDLVDLIVVYKEMGRAAFPSPHLTSSVLCGGVLVAEPGRPRPELLSRVLTGETILAHAIVEDGGELGPEHVTLTATADGDGYRLDGSKAFVPWAHIADQLLVAARTGAASGAVTLFLVDASAVELAPMANIANAKLFSADFAGVRVGSDAVVGSVDAGWDLLGPAIDRAIVARCAEITGTASWLLDAAVGYALERQQFGEPIGRFQAVQYLCTDIAISLHLAELLTRQAAWLLTDGADARRDVSLAKAQAGRAAQVAAQRCHEVHAGVAFMLESDVQVYSRRARVLEVDLGDARHHDEVVAELTVAAG